MINAVIVMGGLGVIIGALLAAASKIFYVYVDPKIVEVDEALPGANCGGCGMPGCSANAEAIVQGKAGPDSCVAGGAELAETIAGIMGMTIEAREPDIARPGCYFGVADADQKYVYDELDDCRAVALLGGGMKVCTIGCLGLGTCARACPFDAIRMGPEGLPVVDEVKCTGCGTCERVCPKHIINLSSVTRRILKEYTTEECTTPCQRRCPAGIDIREYIRQISLGDYNRAVQVIKERNPFPAVIGRICPRPCEEDCRRQYVDTPVAINFLKRFAADYEKASGSRILPYKAPETGRQVAVIGGGVEGLSTAFFVARLGHSVTVYEAGSQPGGLLRSAISANRLPADILDWDIQGVVDMGVKIETGVTVGRDITIAGLLADGADAVFLATGGWDSRLEREAAAGNTGVAEETVPGTYLMMDVLRSPGQIACGENVVIAGGGSTAVAVARACRERGAKTVTLLYRRGLAEAGDDEAPAGKDIRVIHGAAVVRLLGEENRLSAVVYRDLESGEEQTLDADQLLLPSGRYPQMIFRRIQDQDSPGAGDAEATSAAEPLRWEGFEPCKRPDQAGETGLLSSGDVLSDFSGAIKAIGAGRRAAASVHQVMYGIDPHLPKAVLTPDSIIQNVDAVSAVEEIPRRIMPLCRGQELESCGEIERGFDEEAAIAESRRCLQCGLICYKRTGEQAEQPREVSVVNVPAGR